MLNINFQDLSLVRSHLFQFIKFVSTSPVVQTKSFEGTICVLTKMSSFFLNATIHDQALAPLNEALVQEVRSFYLGQGTDKFAWWEKEARDVEVVKDLLFQHEYVPAKSFVGMERSLEGFEVSQKSGVVCAVADAKALKDWVDVVVAGYGLDVSQTEPLFEIFESLYEHDSLIPFVCYDQERPVAASLLFTTNQVAGIYYVATLAEKRGQGFGRTVTNVALLKAIDLKCKHAVLHSTQMGLNLYKALGFEERCVMDFFKQSL